MPSKTSYPTWVRPSGKYEGEKSEDGGGKGLVTSSVLTPFSLLVSSLVMVAMPKLKSVLGKRPGALSFQRQADDQPPKVSKPREFSEGFAMAAIEPEKPEVRPGYSGPKQYSRGSLNKAMALAGSSAEVCATNCWIEAAAPSSRASTKSQLGTWEAVAKRAGFSQPFKLTPNLVFTVVGVLKAADYRSAVNYLEAAKGLHIEMGHDMTPQLRQACRRAARSAKRDLGPSKQAEVIPLKILATFLCIEAVAPGGPLAPGRACLIASWWLLREVEASHVRREHVEVHWRAKMVTIKLPNSKTDLMALGTSRSHSCACHVAAANLCPFHAMVAQLALSSSTPGNVCQWVFPTSDGNKPTKKGWSATFMEVALKANLDTHDANGAPRFSGHSARASGAFHLALCKVELWRIQLFGRWSSQAFLRYIRAAPLANLHELAIEAASPGQPLCAPPPQLQIADAVEHALVPLNQEMQEELADEEAPMANPVNDVFISNSATGGKVHKILCKSEQVHPRHWRTRCGWYFGRGLTAYSFSRSEAPRTHM